MKFTEFLKELAMPVTAPELNMDVAGAVNHDLDMELDDIILSPEIGFYKIRKVLHRYGFDLPALYDIEEIYYYDDRTFLVMEHLDVSFTQLKFQKYDLKEREIATILTEVLDTLTQSQRNG